MHSGPTPARPPPVPCSMPVAHQSQAVCLGDQDALQSIAEFCTSRILYKQSPVYELSVRCLLWASLL